MSERVRYIQIYLIIVICRTSYTYFQSHAFEIYMYLSALNICIRCLISDHICNIERKIIFPKLIEYLCFVLLSKLDDNFYLFQIGKLRLTYFTLILKLVIDSSFMNDFYNIIIYL